MTTFATGDGLRAKVARDGVLLMPQEVAELFNVDTATVGRWARERRLPYAVTPGGHRRYRTEDIRPYLRSGIAA